MPLPTTGMVSSGLLGNLNEFFPTTVNIVEPSGAEDGLGTPVPGGYSAVTGLTGLKGRITPMTDSERRTEGFTLSLTSDWILLQGFYPTITTRMTAQVGGISYNIVTVDKDGGSTFTRLGVELATT